MYNGTVPSVLPFLTFNLSSLVACLPFQPPPDRHQTPLPILNSLRRFRGSHRRPLHQCHLCSPICPFKLRRLGSHSLPTSRPCRVLHSIPPRPSIHCSRLGDQNQQGNPSRTPRARARGRGEQKDTISNTKYQSDIQIYYILFSPISFLMTFKYFANCPWRYANIESAVSEPMYCTKQPTKSRSMNRTEPNRHPPNFLQPDTLSKV